eukprot:COSAG06_NODE_31044_length_527_cov_6.432243_1_plen_84_part_01
MVAFFSPCGQSSSHDGSAGHTYLGIYGIAVRLYLDTMSCMLLGLHAEPGRAHGAGRRPSVPGLARENRKRGSLPSRPVRGFNTA